MAFTYSKLAEVTVGVGGSSTIDFTNIPQNYTDLIVRVSARTTGATGGDQTLIKFNGSTTGYSARLVGGNGSSASSVTIAQYTMPNDTTSQTTSTFNNGEIYIPNYTGSSNKSYSADGVQENNGSAAYAWMTAGLWSNPTAITSIQLYPSADSYAQYTTAYLYGVKAEV